VTTHESALAASLDGPIACVDLEGPIACVDLETTGGMASRHRIIEVGIVTLERGEVVDSWSSLVNPGVRIPPSIAGFTGIDDTMVAQAPTFAEISAEVRRRLDGRLFVAHNARFDYGFLRAEFRRLGERYSAPVLCTVRLSRLLAPEEPRHNLDALIDRHGLTCTARHRALGDAEVLPALLARLAASAGSERFRESCARVVHEPRLPPQLPPDLADDLPDAPGVYVFRDEHAVPLYVGKAGNIRSRVLAHFAASRNEKGSVPGARGHESRREDRDARLARAVRGVEWFETGGDLGALLLERTLVRQWLPLENRRPRPLQDACVIELRETPHGVVPGIEPLHSGSFANDVDCYGPFRTREDALKALHGKAREAGLCLRVLGLESGEGSCVAYQLGRCRGACVGREPRALHDARTRLALVRLRLKRWPFAGAIAIRESAPEGRGSVLHVLDRWQHIGTAADESEVAELLQTRNLADPSIDLDSYRVIGRCLERADAGDLVSLASLPTHA
jgi:DNA polymerase-3 subunit epsilon